MQAAYIVAPFVGWGVAGSLKFLINTARARQLAWKQIGLGGLPSTHTSTVTTPATLIALREGLNTPAFAIAATLAFIVILDAMDLRRRVGQLAARVNESMRDRPPLRERTGHSPVEVVAGLATGIVCGCVLHRCL